MRHHGAHAGLLADTGLGPKYVKVGRTVLYPKEELVSYFREHLYQSTMEYGEVPA